MRKISVLVVDDSAVMRRVLSDVLSCDPAIHIVGTARNGRVALELFSQLKPDVVTLDVEMPVMDGITTLRELRKQDPHLPVIMCSLLTREGAVTTVDALMAGATDYVAKPDSAADLSAAMLHFEKELLPKVKDYGERAVVRAEGKVMPPPEQERPTAVIRVHRRPVRAVCIGVSTGGPNALAAVFGSLAQPLPVPVFVVQHMPAHFTKLLAARLDGLGPMPVCEAEDGQPVVAGHAYVAAGGRHLEVRQEGLHTVLRLHDGPMENSCRPAVDVLFRSVAKVYGSSVVAVVITGMGEDGLRGTEVVREHGGLIIAQDEASSVVWGMPGAVIRAGLAWAEVPLADLAECITRQVRAGRPLQTERSTPESPTA